MLKVLQFGVVTLKNKNKGEKIRLFSYSSDVLKNTIYWTYNMS